MRVHSIVEPGVAGHNPEGSNLAGSNLGAPDVGEPGPGLVRLLEVRVLARLRALEQSGIDANSYPPWDRAEAGDAVAARLARLTASLSLTDGEQALLALLYAEARSPALAAALAPEGVTWARADALLGAFGSDCLAPQGPLRLFELVRIDPPARSDDR